VPRPRCDVAEGPPGRGGGGEQGWRAWRRTGMEPDSGEEGDAENAPVQEEDALLSVSAVSKRAWNHCLECKLRVEKCVFPLCKQVRPYIDHMMELRQRGLAIPCSDQASCKYCNFYTTLKARIELDSAADRKANKALLVLFVGLLQAHKGDEPKNEFKDLLDHVLKCRDRDCKHQVAAGSCRVSQQLLLHLKECKAKQTKQCPLCSLLPANVRRMKQAPRSLPVSFLVKEEINEERRERARQRRLEKGNRIANKQAKFGAGAADAGEVAPWTRDVGVGSHLAVDATPPSAEVVVDEPMAPPPPRRSAAYNETHRNGLFLQEEPNLQSRLNSVGSRKRGLEETEMLGQLKRLKLESSSPTEFHQLPRFV